MPLDRPSRTIRSGSPGLGRAAKVFRLQCRLACRSGGGKNLLIGLVATDGGSCSALTMITKITSVEVGRERRVLFLLTAARWPTFSGQAAKGLILGGLPEPLAFEGIQGGNAKVLFHRTGRPDHITPPISARGWTGKDGGNPQETGSGPAHSTELLSLKPWLPPIAQTWQEAVVDRCLEERSAAGHRPESGAKRSSGYPTRRRQSPGAGPLP